MLASYVGQGPAANMSTKYSWTLDVFEPCAGVSEQTIIINLQLLSE